MLLPPHRPTVLLTTDISTRESSCRGCSGRIPVKTKRIVAMMKVYPAQSTMHGGLITGRKFFYHQQCFSGFMGKNSFNPYTGRCGRCGKFQKISDLQYAYTTRSNYAMTRVCQKCIEREEFQKCSRCHRYALHSLVSPLLEQPESSSPWFSDDDSKVGDICCDSCAASWYLRRAKEQRKIDIEDERFDKKLMEIRELMIKNEFL